MQKLILTSNLFFPNVGGIENSLKSLAIENVNSNSEVVIIVSNIVDGGKNVDSGITNLDGIKVVRYNVPDFSNKLLKLIAHGRYAIKAYKAELMDSRDTVIIARYHWNVIFAYLAGGRNIRYLVPGVVKFQSNKKNRNDSVKFKLKLEMLAQKIALKLSKKVFVFSDTMQKQVNLIANNILVDRVVPGIDSSRFILNGKKTNDKVTLLTMSRLVTAKGINFAIDALQYLPDNYQLFIVGSGPDEHLLKSKVQLLNLDDKVKFLGKQSSPESFYQKSDIFLLPSIYEPFGQTLLEASASGLPTVAFDKELVDTATFDVLGDFAFYANDLTGYSFAETIIEAHKQLLKVDSYKSELRQYVTQKYSWKKLFETLMC
ncbi:MAG: 1,2-diacylglycerol 3-alpha-glucosyltransferase [Psychromonas sp.]|jgi:1,2-diacylglycerol 3-alpha-glucosyltransferase|uniref:glycosyltransferase family 4 protein n=1 Tax=Psychromonas sp. TaxID=1884585 RepID=UPI0039E224E4